MRIFYYVRIEIIPKKPIYACFSMAKDNSKGFVYLYNEDAIML